MGLKPGRLRKQANLQSLERMERMMVRCMFEVSLKDKKRSVDLYSLLGVQYGGCGEAWQIEVVWASGVWRWQGRNVRRGKGRFGKNVWMRTWKCLVYILNRRYSGICGGTSYGQTSNPSVACKKINDDDDDEWN